MQQINLLLGWKAPFFNSTNSSSFRIFSSKINSQIFIFCFTYTWHTFNFGPTIVGGFHSAIGLTTNFKARIIYPLLAYIPFLSSYEYRIFPDKYCQDLPFLDIDFYPSMFNCWSKVLSYQHLIPPSFMPNNFFLHQPI